MYIIKCINIKISLYGNRMENVIQKKNTTLINKNSIVNNPNVSVRGEEKHESRKGKKSTEKKRKLVTITDKDFTIPNYNQSYFLQKYNYKVSQLKDIARFYKLKISGNKDELKSRITMYIENSSNAIKIQRLWKRYILRIYNSLKGPARIYRNTCVNENDFLTMDKLIDVPHSQFYSYIDSTGQIYGFDMLSLYNLYEKSNTQPTNPYNRQSFPKNVKSDIRKIVAIHKYCGDSIKIVMDKPDEVSPLKQLDFRILSVFQEIDNLGNYTNISWFSSLQRVSLIRFIRELSDIWNYRAQLSITTRREICPPVGNPFHGLNLNTLPNMTVFSLKKETVNIIEHMVYRGINNASRALGANYVLCALTLVNTNAAIHLPWLYQSVAH